LLEDLCIGGLIAGRDLAGAEEEAIGQRSIRLAVTLVASGLATRYPATSSQDTSNSRVSSPDLPNFLDVLGMILNVVGQVNASR